jgi:hypothetical protein
MSQHFKSVNRSTPSIAREAISLMLWMTGRVLRLMLRRPLIDILLWMLALWFITGFIGRLLSPEPVLQPEPAAIFVGR